MEKPSFTKVSAGKLDQYLEDFFVRQLGYSADIKNDPDEKPGEAHHWRMVYPLSNSRPFAIAHQANLSTMKRQDVARLYIDKVVKHRDGSPSQPTPILYGFTDGVRLVFFSADTARNRDDRFDLSEETWAYEGVRGQVEAMRVSEEETPLQGSQDRVRFGNLIFRKRLGKLTPQVRFLFDSSPLSADNRFKNYVRDVRRHLMQEVVTDEEALAAVIYHLLESPEVRDSKAAALYADKRAGRKGDKYKLKKSLDELQLELKTRLGDAVAAAVDTLLLRYVMVRFLEAYHPEAMQGLLSSKEMLTKSKRTRRTAMFDGATGERREATLYDAEGVRTSKFSEQELDLAKSFSRSLTVDASKARKGRTRQAEAAQGDLYSLQNVEIVLEEEKKREKQLGGDFYLADLGQAARAIEETLLTRKGTRGSLLLQDFLGRTGETVEETGASRWQFRYEDLKPKTLQDYYESSLSTVVQLTYNAAEDAFKVEVGTSNRQRKELGAYYTNEHLCRFMVERTVKPLFDERLEQLRVSVGGGKAHEARAAFEAVMNFSVCDPTMGSAPFLRSAFDYLVESTQYFQLHRHVGVLKGRFPALYEEIVEEFEFLGTKGGRLDATGIGAWEWHVLRRVLYGVDIDLKAVCIACQTFALSSMRHFKQGERFPSYFNINLKLGNALISPSRPTDREALAVENTAAIADLIRLRRRAQSLPNTEEAYAELVEIFREMDRVRTPIVSKLIEERVYPVLEDFTDELRPFSWELEFPEIFFNVDGTPKTESGFDVVIGNPPWEAIKFNDNEFLRSINAGEGATVEDLCDGNEAVKNAYEHYREVLERWKSWVTEGGQYERQQGGRYRNKWRLATEVSWKLTQPQGAMSLVVPGGIIADDGGFALKQWIFPEGKADGFISFEKENDVFTGSQDFTVMSFRKGCATREVKHIEGLTRAEELFELPYMPITVSLETVQAMSPTALAIPSIRDEVEASLLAKLYQHPLIIDARANWYGITVSYDYNMGHGRPFFRRDGKGIPLLEGKSIKQYEVFPVNQIRIRVTERRQEEPNGQYRVACADVTGTLDARRMICTLVPHGYATGDKLNCFLVEGEDAQRLFLVGILNSFVIEWRVRQLARSNNVKRFMLVQLPVPRPRKPDVERIAALVAALVTSDARFKDLQPLLNGAKPATGEANRHDIKCRIDAEVARLFDLTEEELDRVLDAFDKVPVATKDLVRSHFKKMGTDNS